MANMNSRIFLSGSLVQRDYLKGVKNDLELLGFDVLASWLSEEATFEAAVGRWTELLLADIIAVFDVTPQCSAEVGCALAFAHPIVGVALDKPTETSEDKLLWLPTADHYDTWEDAMIEFFELPSTLRLKRQNKKVSL